MLLAAFHGHIHILDFLLRNGAERSETISCGKNALLVACLQDQQETVAWLVTQGFSLRERDSHGYSPLMLASLGGANRVVPYLKAQVSKACITCSCNSSSLSLCRV